MHCTVLPVLVSVIVGQCFSLFASVELSRRFHRVRNEVVGFDHLELKNNLYAFLKPCVPSMSCRGVRDLSPLDMQKRKYIFKLWEAVAERAGYEEYDTPILEQADSMDKVWERSAYLFVDKGGRNVKLRPELTRSLLRMVGDQQSPFPGKYFSIGQCWRYERPMAGRKREHFQWNVDILDVTSPIGEAEVLFLAISALRELGFDSNDIVFFINHRGILEDLLSKLGIDHALLPRIQRLFDTPRSKIIPGLAVEGLTQMGCNLKAATTLVEMISKKLNLDDLASLLPNSQAVKELKDVLYWSDVYGIKNWLDIHLGLVRGLSYYSATVFEAFDRNGQFRALLGGGRYSALVKSNKFNKLVTGIGFGFGDVALTQLMESRDMFNSLMSEHRTADIVVWSPVSAMEQAIKLSNGLRNEGWKTDLLLSEMSMAEALGRAKRRNANAMILVPEKNTIVLKRLADEYQVTCTEENLTETVTGLLE